MNANDLIADLELEPSWTGEERTILLRALRLLAAAEGGEGTPETDAFGIQPVSDLLISHVMRTQAHTELESLLQEWGKFARRLERERNALAARVRELEAGGDLHAMMERMSK